MISETCDWFVMKDHLEENPCEGWVKTYCRKSCKLCDVGRYQNVFRDIFVFIFTFGKYFQFLQSKFDSPISKFPETCTSKTDCPQERPICFSGFCYGKNFASVMLLNKDSVILMLAFNLTLISNL